MRRSFTRAVVGAVAALAVGLSLLVAAPASAAEVAPAEAAAQTSAAPAAVDALGASTGATALSGSQFNPGYIISDANFYDRYAMTEAEIQTFLNTMIASTTLGRCDNYNCLAIKTTPTFYRAADAVCRAYEPRPDGQPETTAAIIFKVQQACGISARVLLVTLQKEQSLLTTNAPTDSKIARAMGYACPDSAGGACDAYYSGLYNQLYSAGRQLVRYSNPPGTENYFTWYPVGRTVNILYHPNSALCGAGPVTIQNSATAALYYYTPYQPNTAALANLGRTGDECSSYGNRNFWYYYSLWFGDPTKPRGAAYGQITEAVGTPAGIKLSGWAVIPESPSTSVHLSVEMGGIWTPLSANLPNSDSLVDFPDAGGNHGFSMTLPAGEGPRSFCLWASGLVVANVLECRTVTVPRPEPPVGAITSARGVDGGIEVEGWAVLPARPTEPAHLASNLGASWMSITADRPGATQAEAAVPGAGTDHGFRALIPAPPGQHTFCIWASGVVGAVNLECRTVTVPRASDPDGAITSVATAPGTFTVSGWAVQPNSPSTSVHLAINIGARWIPVSASLPDGGAAAAAYPGIGSNHGFTVTVPAAAGSQSFCLWASGPHGAVILDCRSVSVPREAPPAGAITSLTSNPTGFSISGWAVQPGVLDTKVHLAVNIGSRWISVEADQPGAAEAEANYPGAGTTHAFNAQISAPVGTHSFCLWASGISAAYVLECRTVTVSAVPPPAGQLTEVVGVPGGFRIAGWMVLPTSLGTKVHMAVNIGSRWISVEADQPGATAAEANYPGAGTDHAFSAVIPASRGSQSFCLWVEGVASTAIFECRSVVVP